MLMLPTTLTPADPVLNNGLLEVVFIDPGVVGWESLAQGVRPGVAVVLLDADQDGLAQMALWAGSQKDVAALHVLSHGSSAQLKLGSLTLTTQALHDRSADLAALGASLTAEGDVLLYGCNVASGDAGVQFVAQMADLTGADISASENATGAALFGGDWLLEAQVGPLESVSPFGASAQDAYWGLLGVGNLNFDALPYTPSTNASTVNLGGWIFSGGNLYALGTFDELGFAYLSAPNNNIDRVLVLNANSAPGVSSFTFKSADDSNFDLSSFSLGSMGATGLTISAYRDGTPWNSESFDLSNTTYSSGQITYTKVGSDGFGAYGSLTLRSAFDNVDEIRLVFNGDAIVEIDDIIASPAIVPPAITSATYNASTGQLTVTGTNLVAAVAAPNDIDASKFTLTGEGGSTYTLNSTANVDIANSTSFTLSLSAADQAAVNQILNKNGTSSTGATTYNLAAAEDWALGADAAAVIADNTGNGITVSNVPVPSITSAHYDVATGVLNVTGSGFVKLSGATNDIDTSKFTFTGEGGSTYTLTDTSNAEITSGTGFSLTLSSTDKAGINKILNKNGTSSTSGTTYNLAAAEDWAAGAASAVVTADATGNGITVSNVAVPSITSAYYDGASGVLNVTGTGFLSKSGAANDIDTSKFTFTGEGGSTYTLTDTSNAEITNGTSFSLTLSSTDKAGINTILNQNGTSSRTGTTYNLAAAEDWAMGADVAVTVADYTGNGVTVSNAPPPPSTTVASAQFSADTGSGPSDFVTSVAAQTVSGTLSANLVAGESVWISWDNGATWSAALSAVGTNTWSSSTTLVGSSTMKVRVESSAGYGNTYAQAYILDTTQPSAPSTPDLTSGSDLGVSASDNITYDSTPTLTGTAESGSVVAVYDTDGTTVLGTATATGGNWTITTSTLTAGSHVVSAKGTDTAGNVSAPSAGLSITIDSTAPAVSSVAVPANGTYAAGTALDFTVNFNEAVTVDTTGGTPWLALTLDTGGTVYASYASGSGSSALTFRYTIVNGDMDANGVVVGSLHANGASVTDTAGNSANLTLSNVGATNQILVDGEAPAVSSVSVPANGSYKAADTLDFAVNFSEAVIVDTMGGTPQLALTLDTGGTVYASYVSGSGSSSLMFRYTLAEGLADSNGITVGSLSSSGGTLRDAAGNDATLTLNSVGATTAVLVDTTAPSVSSVSVPADGTYKVGDNLDFTVNYGEAVVVTGTPRIALTVGAETVYASYVSGSGTSALTYRYTVESGKVDADGVTVGAMSMNGGSVRDAAGNLANVTLNNTGPTVAVLVDGAAPNVTAVSSSATNAVYKVGDNIAVQVTFSENVTVTGTPQLTLETGTTDQVVNYASGSGTHTLTFNYTVQAGDTSNDLDYFSTTALALNGGTIKDSAGNQATLTLASPGAVNSLSSTKSLVVDTTAPAVSSVSVPANGTYRPGNPLNFTVNFSENVTVTGSPVLTLTLDTGGTVEAAYTSGSGTSALMFRYTVSAGNIDADGITVGALDLKGGALRDVAGQDAVLTLNNVASTAAVRVDNAIAPPIFEYNDFTNVVSVFQGNGYTMETLISPRPGGGTNTTQTIAPVVVPVADIPLGGSVQAPALLAELPVGVGLQSFGGTNLSQGMTNPESWVMQDLQQFILGQALLSPTETIQSQAANFLQGLSANDEMSFRVISLVAAGSNLSPIVVDIRPPDTVLNAGSAIGLVIDTQALGPGSTTLQLNNVDFAAIVGAARVVGGSGPNWVVGDSASQVIFLGPGDDVLHGGGGNDTIASTTGRDRLFGGEGNDLLVGGRDSDVMDGGDGDDVIQGGDSDAGTWSFSIVKGELVSQFVHANALLAPQDSLRHVGPWWSDASQTQHLDDRLAFSLESLERLQLVSSLYGIATGRLPDLDALNFYSTGGMTDTQLAQLAVDALLSTMKDLPLEAQVRSLIFKAWGTGPASDALLPEALAYLANGGHWGDGFLALLRSSEAVARFSVGRDSALSQDFVSSELGWSSASGHDFLHGGSGNDRLVGGDGNDVIYGGAGTDLAALMGQLTDYVVQFSRLGDNLGVLLRNTLTSEEDFLTGVELLQLGGQYFRLPEADSLIELPLQQTILLHDFVIELDWQEVQLVGAHLLGNLA